MRRNKTKKARLVTLLLILVLLISVGYAALTTNFSITGNTTISKQSWSIYFTNIVPDDENNSVASVTTAPTLSNNNTTVTWAVSMDTPGQVYSFNVDVKNDGSLDAMVNTATNSIVTSTLTQDQQKYLEYTITYVNGLAIERYDKLAAGETKTITIKLKYKEDVDDDDLPTTAQNGIALSYTADYVQADDELAVTKVTTLPEPVSLQVGDTVTYSTVLNNVTLSNWRVFYTKTINDEDYVYLIATDYIPNAAVDTTNTSFEKGGTYTIYTDGSYGLRQELLNLISTKSNWSDLLVGTLNGKSIDYSDSEDTNVWAMGGPTIELFIESWNSQYTEEPLYAEYNSSTDLPGYYVGDSPNPTTKSVNIADKEGFDNTLFVTHKDDLGEQESYCSGYWFASPTYYEDGLLRMKSSKYS